MNPIWWYDEAGVFHPHRQEQLGGEELIQLPARGDFDYATQDVEAKAVFEPGTRLKAQRSAGN